MQKNGTGLDPPEAARKGLEAWREESNPVADFLKERTHDDPEAWTATADLHRMYLLWNDDLSRKNKRLTVSQFGSALAKLGYKATARRQPISALAQLGLKDPAGSQAMKKARGFKGLKPAF